MFKPEKLYALLKQNNLSSKDFFESANITAQAWRNTCSGADIGVRKVERIATQLGVSIEYFFEPEATAAKVGHSVNGTLNTVSGDIIIGRYETEITYLKQLLDEKERLINLLLNRGNAEQKQNEVL